MKNKSWSFLVIGLLINLIVEAQVDSSYNEITFLEFLNSHITNDSLMLREVHRNTSYPTRAREQEVEELVKIQIINHNENEVEFLFVRPSHPYFSTLPEQLKTTISPFLKNRKVPFKTYFYLHFDLLPTLYQKSDRQKNGLIDGDTWLIQAYSLRDIGLGYEKY